MLAHVLGEVGTSLPNFYSRTCDANFYLTILLCTGSPGITRRRVNLTLL